jgi:predicted molibdopterin-dependent oxidoreductase YjgC
MIDMGVHPGLDAGYVSRSEPGRDTRKILEAAFSGEIDTLLIFGADPIGDFPDADLAREALAGDVFAITVEIFPTDTVALSDVILPSAAYAEREGTFTNLERRLQKLESNVPPPGTATDPWRICARLAKNLGEDWGWNSVSDVWAAITKEVPSHEDVELAALEQLSPVPRPEYEQGWQGGASYEERVVSGPGAQYPKGYRSGFPAQSGHAWPLSWEIREFEARQRPGIVPDVPSHRRDDETAELGNGGKAESRDDETAELGNGGDSDRRDDETAGVDNAENVGQEEPTERSGFALYTGRLIYDEGAMVSRSTALRNIAQRPFIEMDQQDAASLALEDGDEAVVALNGKEFRAKVVVADIARGAVFIPYQQRGLPTNELIAGADPVVEIRKP